MYKHLLIATDGSALSLGAVRSGVSLAKESGAKVSVLTVTEPFHVFSLDIDQVEDTAETYRRHATERADQILTDAEGIAAAAGVKCGTMRSEDEQPHRAIIAAAEKNGCDLIVMGSHGRRGISALVIGSQTANVLANSTIPVLVHPARAVGTPDDERAAAQGAAPELV
jgi:nucleotide-binding universal stress UspA family protein